MDRQKFEVSSNHEPKSTTVKDWMQSVQDGHSPDRLSEIDKIIDGSIGAFKDAFEHVLGTSCAVPLFEFRRLEPVKTGDIKNRVDEYEQAVMAYHTKYAKHPARFKRNQRDAKFSNIKGQDSTACAPKKSATATRPPSSHH